MKLVLAELSEVILSDTKPVTEWVIESPNLLSQYVQELIHQCGGEEGGFVLSDNDKIVEISKYMEIILNPFGVQINSKKILTKLYSDLDKLAKSEQMYLQTCQVMQSMIKYLLELEYESDYILEFEHEFDLIQIFKAVGIRHEIMEEDYFENLIRYIKIVSRVLGTKIVVFVNIRSYFDDIQLEQLLKEAAYQEIQILLIENQQKACLKDVFRYIIDNDKCEIF